MQTTVLRFNFASPQGNPRTQSKLLSAALELAQWGESKGITAVSVDEHHVTGHGWSSNPILAASMFLARTSKLVVGVDCALGPLWHPVRMAEDIALVDNMSRGRLFTTVGLGYRECEYEALGVDFSRRGKLLDDLITRMLAIWAENGTWTRPHPMLFVGGGVKATAQRAARFGLPLSLVDYLPEVADHYRELCAAKGVTPFVMMPGEVNRGMIYLHDDPDKLRLRQFTRRKNQTIRASKVVDNEAEELAKMQNKENIDSLRFLVEVSPRASAPRAVDAPNSQPTPAHSAPRSPVRWAPRTAAPTST